MTDLFELPARPRLPVEGEDTHFPVHRIFCVGRNYEAHSREMGFSPKRDAPIYFTKAAAACCPSGRTVAYPPGTENCHYEVELVVAIGAPAFAIDAQAALSVVLGFACGLDLTRRDLQNASRNRGRPWDTGKDFENAAVLGAITRAETFGEVGDQEIALTLNGERRQQARLSQMVWPIDELIADLSRYYHLRAGDLIYTGTPAGVGPVAPGDRIVGTIDGLSPVELTIRPPK